LRELLDARILQNCSKKLQHRETPLGVAHTATWGQKGVNLDLAHTHEEPCDREVEWCLADRELALFKIGVPHGKARTEILELSDIFSGKVVDVGPEALTVAISGDPGKLFAFETAVQPLGLKQLSRTGRITLLKSDEGLDLPAFGPLAPSKTLERDYERARQGAQSACCVLFSRLYETEGVFFLCSHPLKIVSKTLFTEVRTISLSMMTCMSCQPVDSQSQGFFRLVQVVRATTDLAVHIIKHA
jgi:hypothetical protein